MLLVLLAVLLRVRAEWVEIAQNSYRRTSYRKGPVPTELTPESYKIYPNSTLSGPDWQRGNINRVGDVRRVPGAPPRRPGNTGAVAANKQEYYDIDGPDEVNAHGQVTSPLQEPTEIPVRLNNLDNEGGGPIHPDENKWGNIGGLSLKKGQSGSVKQVKNPQQIVDEQPLFQKGQFVDQTHEEVLGEDHLNLNKIMQHFVESLKKPNDDPLNKNKTDAVITKDVEFNIKNTLSQTVSSESNQEKDLTEKTADKSKYFPGVWRMIRTVANIISMNTQKGVNSKIKYLEDLKNKLLYNIQERIDSVWPAAGRAAREAEARGHVELPSSEGALMTISFLTFAVFLIKLVLQIIHTYKNKTMMMTPAVVTAVGRAAAAAAAFAKN